MIKLLWMYRLLWILSALIGVMNVVSIYGDAAKNNLIWFFLHLACVIFLWNESLLNVRKIRAVKTIRANGS